MSLYIKNSISQQSHFPSYGKPCYSCPYCNKPMRHKYKWCIDCKRKLWKPNPEKRFWKHVKKTITCWIWMAAKAPWGYGVFDKTRAHRFSWEIHKGKIPKGKFVCHKCDNPSCVRPSHLWLGKPKENTQDMIFKKRMKVGSQLPHSKLTEKDIKEMRKLHSDAQLGARKLAKIYGVTHANVDFILRYKTWRHVH